MRKIAWVCHEMSLVRLSDLAWESFGGVAKLPIYGVFLSRSVLWHGTISEVLQSLRPRCLGVRGRQGGAVDAWETSKSCPVIGNVVSLARK